MEEKKVLSVKVKRLIAVLAAVFIFAAGIACGFFWQYFAGNKAASSVYWMIDRITENSLFYEGEDLKEFTAEDYGNAIRDKIRTYDDYFEYYTAEEYSALSKKNDGAGAGVGLSFLTGGTDRKIFRVVYNSPADRAGLKAGDTVVSAVFKGAETPFTVNADITAFLAREELSSGEEFTFKITRGEEQKSFVLYKAEYERASVYYADKEGEGRFLSDSGKPLLTYTQEGYDNPLSLGEKAAYIKLTEFHGYAASEMGEVIALADERGKTEIILDLRNNGGGSMDVLRVIAKYFLKSDAMFSTIGYSVDKDGRKVKISTDGSEYYENLEKLVVIANENTASASECLIGGLSVNCPKFNLQENLVVANTPVGKEEEIPVARTYGKGIMQTTFVNPMTGEAVKMTTAKLIWADEEETCIHKVGIKAHGDNAVSENNAINRAIEILEE